MRKTTVEITCDLCHQSTNSPKAVGSTGVDVCEECRRKPNINRVDDLIIMIGAVEARRKARFGQPGIDAAYWDQRLTGEKA